MVTPATESPGLSKRTRGPFASVKITDVAAAAGVAPMTVSRVINTPERVAAETATRVRAAIEALGYVPNMIAGGLSSRRSRMIAAIVPTIASPMFSLPVQTFTSAMGRAGYQVLLGLSSYSDETEDALLAAVLARRPDGLLLTGARHSARTQRLLAGAQVPVVEIWDTAERHTDILVGFDHFELGGAVADFFAERGHTHYAVLAAGDSRAAARRAGFVARVAHHGGILVAEQTLPAPSGIIDGRGALREILPALPERTAVMTGSDLVAFGVITEARVIGLDVPKRLAVCGFGDFELSRGSVPTITTVRVDGAEMGRLAAEHLLERINARPGTPPIARQTVVPFTIVERDST